MFEKIDASSFSNDTFGKEYADSLKSDSDFGKEFADSFKADSGFGKEYADSLKSGIAPEKNPDNHPLTDEDREKIKKETGWPDEIVDNIATMEEYKIYKEAGLEAKEINGKWCLINKDIDMNHKDEFGRTNKERMEQGLAPLDKHGNSVELHHIGQKPNSPLAELTQEEHRGRGNDTILHDKTKQSEIDRGEFQKEKESHWETRAGQS